MFLYFKNVDESLIVDDPIYGEIVVPYPFSKIVLTREMQRLSGISQNGFSQLEFEGLEFNDRLSHSVGAFHVMSLFLNQLEKILHNYNIELSKDDKDIALCSMLLHDIGHGPFSHTLELVTNYSHEKRTTDILLGDTEVNKVITHFFGKDKVKKIASFIAEINDSQVSKDSFTKLLNNLVSYQLDADRIDYLVRDAHYVDLPSAIDLKRLISSVNVAVNNDKEYELLIDRKGLSCVENILLQRYQMYRDVYLCPMSALGDYIFKEIIERYRNNPLLQSKDISVTTNFRNLAADPRVSNLEEFIEMTDLDFKISFGVLARTDIDPVLSYLCKFNMDDYILIENDIPIEKIKIKLKEIFGDIDLDNTLSIMSMDVVIKSLYKKDQKLNIQNGNRIMDLTECSYLIRPQEATKDTYLFFNPELLRIELGLSVEEFKEYEDKVRKMIEDLNKKPEEFELKYIIDDVEVDRDTLLDQIIATFQTNGFSVVSISNKQNNDEYYDTRNLDLFKNGGSLRVRRVNQSGKEKIKATYKEPLEKGEVYSSRTEIEGTLPDTSFETFKEEMTSLGVTVDFDSILEFPILNSITDRTDIVLDKNGIEVCLSFDSSSYTNHLLDTSVSDRMIEIEAIGELNNRIILNEIHEFISSLFGDLSTNKQSKYERGIKSTLKLYKDLEDVVTGGDPSINVLIKAIKSKHEKKSD